MHPKNILITGGTGYLGSYLAKRLSNEHNLLILKRKSSKLEKIKGIIEKVSLVNIDEFKEIDVFKNFNLDLIIHCATEYGRKNKSVKDVIGTNILMPLWLVEIAKKYNADFINIDTYFNVKNISYSYLPNYILTKKHFAEIAKNISEQSNIRLINLRLEHLYGPNDNENKFIPWLVKECSRNAAEIKLTCGKQIRDLIYIDDAVEALYVLVNNINKINYGPTQIGLGSGKGVSIKEISETIKKEAKSSSKLIFGYYKYRDNEIMQSISNNKILKNLGWVNKTSLREGVKKMTYEIKK